VTASNGWRADELCTIDGCGEVDIATRRSDGTSRAVRIVWIVRHGNAVYVRLVNGTTTAGCSGLDDALDAAIRGKYGRLSSAVVRITADVARATTLRIEPAWTLTPDHLNEEKDTTCTRTPAAPR
jgi:hypothetical protein